MPRSGRPPTNDEINLWNQAMADAKPLKRKRKASTLRKPLAELTSEPEPPKRPARKPAAPVTVLKAPPAPKAPALQPALAADKIAGLDGANARRLRRGEMQIDASLDLHGMTREVAHDSLTRFLRRASAHFYRCVLVVTGKGRGEGSGVLRSEVPRWLNEPALRALVIAITAAQPKHGGGGALYVLLKRQKPER